MPGLSGMLGEALLAVCRLERPASDVYTSPTFSTRLGRHRLRPLMHVVLSRAGRPDVAGAEQGFLAAVGGHTRNLAVLRALHATFGSIDWVVLKGPVLSELAHPVPGARQYADIDVLLGPEDLREGVGLLQGAGWRQLDGNHRLLLERMPGELHFLGPHGAQIDLHWSLLNNQAVRRSSRLSPAPLLSRRTYRTVGPLELPTLDDIDFLLHLCVHAAQSGADRLLWLLDVDQWVRNFELDWHEFLHRAQATDVRPACFVVLGRAVAALSSPVPHHVLSSLSGIGVWHMAEVVARKVQPVERIAHDRSAARLIARASRRDGGRSSRELLRRTAASVRPRVHTDTSWRDEPDSEAWEQFLSRAEADDRGGQPR